MREIALTSIKVVEEVVKSSKEYISLSQGLLKVGGIPQPIKDHVATLMKSDTTDYYESSAGIPALREKIRDTLNAHFNITLPLDQVIITHGCMGGLSLLHLTLLSPGDEVILPEPTYPAYPPLSELAQCKAVYVSMAKHRKDSIHWELDIDRIKAATTSKTRMILFSNPWNPLGIFIPKKTLLELIAWCEKKQIYLAIDEAFREFVFEGTFDSTIPLVLQSEWVISANTFSKSLGMSGWRVGYLVIPKKLQTPLNGMQNALLNCLNNPGQFGALFALSHPEFTQKFRQIVNTCRDTSINALKPLVNAGIISFTAPACGFYLFLKADPVSATQLCNKILTEAKVGLIPGHSCGPSGDPFMRLCYARSDEVLKEGLRRLTSFLTAEKKKKL